MKTGIRIMQFTKANLGSVFLMPFMRNFKGIFG